MCTLLGCNAAVMSVEFDLAESSLLAATANDFSVRVWTIADARLRVRKHLVFALTNQFLH